ncbi:hypothetical protein COOONC_28407 [Cooperia oncophora]
MDNREDCEDWNDTPTADADRLAFSNQSYRNAKEQDDDWNTGSPVAAEDDWGLNSYAANTGSSKLDINTDLGSRRNF